MAKPSIVVNFKYSKTKYSNANNSFSFIDYITYNNRDNACPKEYSSEKMFNYYNYRVGSTGQFNDKGLMRIDKTIDTIKLYKPQVVYRGVISFDNEFVDKYDFKDVQSMRELIGKSIKPALEKSNLTPDNIEFGCFYHTNTDNPHVHFYFYEKVRTKKLDRLSRKEMTNFKSTIMNNVVNNIEHYATRDTVKKELIKNVDYLLQENLNDFPNFKNDIQNSFKFKKQKAVPNDIKEQYQLLLNLLPNSKSMKYNSENIKPFHKEIKKLTHLLLQHENNKNVYDMFTSCLDKEFELYQQQYGENINNDFLNNRMTQIETRIGNLILSNIKNNRLDNNDLINNRDLTTQKYLKVKSNKIKKGSSSVTYKDIDNVEKKKLEKLSKIPNHACNNVINTRCNTMADATLKEISSLMTEMAYTRSIEKWKIQQAIQSAILSN